MSGWISGLGAGTKGNWPRPVSTRTSSRSRRPLPGLRVQLSDPPRGPPIELGLETCPVRQGSITRQMFAEALSDPRVHRLLNDLEVPLGGRPEGCPRGAGAEPMTQGVAASWFEDPPELMLEGRFW